MTGETILHIGGKATRELARKRLVVSTPRGAGKAMWLGAIGLGVAAVVAGSEVAGRWHAAEAALIHSATLPAPASGLADAAAGSQQKLDNALLDLKLAQSRSKELERQIDTLNQRLRESQEELTFFRKAQGRDKRNAS